ncbi:amino acid adenylation domain-containing protein [Lachnospiraceae bacterium 10-1]|nr:amino acid adenylation domain-containing protein [Lachnospiraceae bacterium 10-1]
MITNVLEYLRKSASEHPDKAAFIDENKSMTFMEINVRAMQLASCILEECGEAYNKPIAVYMDKSVDSIIAFMAILYSGNFYVPIDKKSPKERIERILDVLEPIVIINQGEHINDLERWKNINYEDSKERVFNEKELIQRLNKVLDVDPVYVLFTSGSTGIPKGVAINHRSIIDYIEWLYGKFEFDDKTIFGEQAPFYFDNSILDIYSTLKNASTMVIIPEKFFAFPNKLCIFLNEYKINTIFWVPSALIGVANSGVLEREKLLYLEKVLFCGEVMPNKQLNIWRKFYPNLLYANLYGPTEITDVCAYYIVNREFEDDEPLPIGKACKNTQILVLNEENALVKEGEIGELCVRGSCLSLGYYKDFEKTDNVFVQNPLNKCFYDTIYKTGDLVRYNELGELIYVCRKDFQIKHQGHRIELGEIETAASSIDEVYQCCALYDDLQKKIVLFYVGGENLTEKEIYTQMMKKVPKYMMPGVIHRMEKFPLNINGKIDRVKLKELM